MKRKIKMNKLTMRIVSIFLMSTLPIVIALFIVNYYAIDQVKKQVFSSNKNILSVYMDQIDSQLNNVREFLRKMDAQQNYINGFQSQDKEKIYYSANNYRRLITTEITNHQYLEGFLLFSENNYQYVYSFSEDSFENYFDRVNIIDYIMDIHIKKNDILNKWCYVLVEDKAYLIYTYRLGDSYFCSWTSIQKLTYPTIHWKIEDDAIVAIEKKGDSLNNFKTESPQLQVLSENKDQKESKNLTSEQVWTITEDSSQGDFQLIAYIYSKNVLKPFINILYIAVIILLLFFLIIPFILLLLNKNIFYPMKKMQEGIVRLKAGDFDHVISTDKVDNEFNELIMSFNQMTKQVRNYKIQVYEDKIKNQKLELQFLQVQIEPHFYLNALSTINVMAQMGDLNLIEDLSRNLSQYMRYLSGAKMKLVPLKEEIEHLKHYTSIIQTEMSEMLNIDIGIEKSIEAVLVPPLIIQTFVENSIKYAVDVYKKSFINVWVQPDCLEGKPVIQIRVEDNGPGYPAEIIQAVNASDIVSLGNKLGIMNAKKRIHYFYHQQARIQIKNLEQGGACALIWIPIKQGE